MSNNINSWNILKFLACGWTIDQPVDSLILQN